MRAIGVFLGLAVALTAHAPAWAKSSDTVLFQASSQWALEYADQSCRLIRNFTDGREEVTLAFERFLPGPELRLGIAGNALRARRSQTTIKFRYGPVDEELAAASKIDSLSVGEDVEVRLGPMEAPLRALQTCIADLVADWGIDMERMAHATHQAEPINPPQSWMTSHDYPGEMLMRGRAGTVGFRLVVDEQGEVKHCFVDIDQPGPFEVATCNAVKKNARFKPALDVDGNPMPAIYSCSVHFVL